MTPGTEIEPINLFISTVLAQQEPPSKASPYILFRLFGVVSLRSINFPAATLSAWKWIAASVLNER